MVERFRWNPKTSFSYSMGWTSSVRQEISEAVVNVEQFWKYRSNLQSDSENISLIIFWMLICSVLGVVISSENNLKLKELRVSSWNQLSGMNIVIGIYWCHKRWFHFLETSNCIACYTGTGSFSPNEYILSFCLFSHNIPILTNNASVFLLRKQRNKILSKIIFFPLPIHFH